MREELKIQDVIVTVKSIALVFPETVFLALTILILGVIGGLLFALIRQKKIIVLSQLGECYVSYMRSVPLIINLFIISSIIPKAFTWMFTLNNWQFNEANIPKWLIIICCFTLHQTAIQSENIRGLLKSIDKNQLDAAYSIGYKKFDVYWRIIGPQVLATAIPIFLNSFVKLIKAMSLGFAVGFVDILAAAKLTAALQNSQVLSYFTAACVYWVVCGGLTFVIGRYEVRLNDWKK